MKFQIQKLPQKKRIALIAHDNCKIQLIAWAKRHLAHLKKNELFATSTTGSLLRSKLHLDVTCLESGPLGGDQQIGAMISRGEIDVLIFLWDPFEPHPHDPDVRALLRVAAVWNIPLATNLSTADFIFDSHHLQRSYERKIPLSKIRKSEKE